MEQHTEQSSSPIAGSSLHRRNVAGEDKHPQKGACSCEHKHSVQYSNKDHSVPEFMRANYIIHGYRMNLSFVSSFMSLFKIHNETLNIWTALLSFAVFFGICLRILFGNDDEMTFWEKGTYVVYSLTACYTFLGSLLYHWFNCISQNHFECFLRMDISGIGFLICGSYYPPIYYAFQNQVAYGIFYLTCITIGCMMTSAMLLIPRFSDEKYSLFRVAVLSCTGLFGIIPLVHLFYLHEGGLQNPIFYGKLMAVLELYGWYGLAVAFYASKIPERLFPGKFDVVGCSHQFWHIFVFVATYCHYRHCLTTHSIVHISS
jgi:adiponectin receptor